MSDKEKNIKEEDKPSEEPVKEESVEAQDISKDTPSEEPIKEESVEAQDVSKETPSEEPVKEEAVEASDTSKDVPSEEPVKEEAVEASDEDSVKLPFIIGRKIGMTQLFSEDGSVYPSTMIQCGPCFITQVKNNEKEGYTAIQLGFSDAKDSNTNKSLVGHYKKAGISSKKHMKEFRYSNINEEISLGKKILVNQFNEGDYLNVIGTSIGKGFAGHMKRHNFGGGRRSHGKNSVMRKAGSVGAGTDPGKVWRGTRMAGRMGNEKVTTKNLEVLKINLNENMLFIKGSVPGPNNRIVYLLKSN